MRELFIPPVPYPPKVRGRNGSIYPMKNDIEIAADTRMPLLPPLLECVKPGRSPVFLIVERAGSYSSARTASEVSQFSEIRA